MGKWVGYNYVLNRNQATVIPVTRPLRVRERWDTGHGEVGRGFWCVVCDGVGARGCLRGLHSPRGTPRFRRPSRGVVGGGRDIGMVAVMGQPRTAAMVVVAVAAAASGRGGGGCGGRWPE